MDNVYSLTPLTESHIKALKKNFLTFFGIFPIALELMKKDFIRSWLKPMVWGFIVFVGIGLLSLLMLLLGLFTNSITPNLSSNPIINTVILVIASLFIVATLLALMAVAVYFSYDLTTRSLVVLNNRDYSSIWKIKSSENIQTLTINVIILALILFAISLPASFLLSPITFIISVFSTVSKSAYVGGQALNSIISMVPALTISSFFGYAIFLVALEKNGPWKAVKNSFIMVKKYYFKNVIRWLPVSLPGLGVGILLNAALSDYSLQRNSGGGLLIRNWLSSPELFTVNTPYLSIVSGVLILIAVLIGLVCLTTYYIFVYYYTYVSFLNIRLIQTKKFPLP